MRALLPAILIFFVSLVLVETTVAEGTSIKVGPDAFTNEMNAYLLPVIAPRSIKIGKTSALEEEEEQPMPMTCGNCVSKDAKEALAKWHLSGAIPTKWKGPPAILLAA